MEAERRLENIAKYTYFTVIAFYIYLIFFVNHVTRLSHQINNIYNIIFQKRIESTEQKQERIVQYSNT